MSVSWPEVRLGDVLIHVPRPIDVMPDEIYREIGIRSHGKGVFHKEPSAGLDIGDKRVFRVEPGDFLLNIVFAWEGAVAIAGASETGTIASHRFPTFRAQEERLDPRFLLYFFQTRPGLALLDRVSPGGAGRNRTLSRAEFLKQHVPLPSLDEQRRIIVRINELESKIKEAQSIRTDLQRSQLILMSAAVDELIRSIPMTGRLEDVLDGVPRDGWSAPCDNIESGTPVLSLGAATGFRHRAGEFKRTSALTVPGTHYWLKSGDLLITRSNTPNLVGHAAIYNGNPSPCIFPDLMMRIPVDPRRASIDFVHWVLQSKRVRDFVRHNATGTSPTMKKINQGTVMSIPFPSSLPLDMQCSLAAKLEKVGRRLEQVERTRADVCEALDAVMPAVLAKAFRGEL
jgi:type I restriction enzyme, S subunit